MFVSKKFYDKCSEYSISQIVFRTDIFRKLTLGAPVGSAAENSEWTKTKTLELRRGSRLSVMSDKFNNYLSMRTKIVLNSSDYSFLLLITLTTV